MNEQQKHEMILDKTHPSGVEEWNCPSCGRCLLINWEPQFKKTVLQAGDEYAIHSGGKGGLKIGPMQASLEDKPIAPDEEPSLAPWVAWLEKSDFESLWNDEAE